MSPNPIQNALGLQGGHNNLVTDDKKHKRMISNRESARRSRTRKQQYFDDLVKEAAVLQQQNVQIELQVNVSTQHFYKIDYENSILKAQVSELTERLQSLNSMLHVIQDFSGFAMDIPEILDVLEPWQLPFPIQPIRAAADMFPI